MLIKRLQLLTAAACACAAAAVTLLSGCASTNSDGVPHLSDGRAQKIVTAADQLTMVGGPVPDAIENLNPIQVYADHGNIVIAMRRDAQGEKGFYIVASTSSYNPTFSPRPGWNYTLVNPSDPYVNSLFQYSRK